MAVYISITLSQYFRIAIGSYRKGRKFEGMKPPFSGTVVFYHALFCVCLYIVLLCCKQIVCKLGSQKLVLSVRLIISTKYHVRETQHTFILPFLPWIFLIIFISYFCTQTLCGFVEKNNHAPFLFLTKHILQMLKHCLFLSRISFNCVKNYLFTIQRWLCGQINITLSLPFVQYCNSLD